MSRRNDSERNQEVPAETSRPSRSARLQALLFAGAALGTTLLTLAAAEPKLPRLVGE